MTTAERIGLFPGFDLAAGHGFIITLLILLSITPGMMILIGLVGESRLIPMNPKRQFISFSPGEFFLCFGVACMMQAARQLPDKSRWFTATWFQLLLLVVAFGVGVGITYAEWKEGTYPARSIFSPTKIYHNGGLYILLGYLIGSTTLAVLVGSDWTNATTRGWFGLSLIGFLPWAFLVIAENGMIAKQKAQYAHPSDWKPIWVR